MKGQKHRIFKLGIPLEFKLENSELVIKGSFSNYQLVKLDELESFKISPPDADGFALFEVIYSTSPKQKKIKVQLPTQVEAYVNGYTLFHSSVPKSIAYGSTKSIYEYYEREGDLAYYALIKREGSKTKKFLLGSLRNPSSRIHQMARIIHRNFRRNEAFNRKILSEYLPSPLKSRQLMKCMLDILTTKKFLRKSDVYTKKRRIIEIFTKTEEMEKFMIDPRSFSKPNGLNVGQRALTSDHNAVHG